MILHRYVAREIIKYTVGIMIAVVAIYLAVDFFEKYDDFLEAGLPLSKAITFFIYNLPFIVSQIWPVGVLLSVIVALGTMDRKNEIIALKSCGISTWFILKPVLIIGVLSTVILFLISEVIVPITSVKANYIWLKEVRHESMVISREKDIWLKDNRMILHIDYFSKSDQSISGVTIYYFGDDFKMVRRIDAQRGEYVNKQWQLSSVMEQVLDPQTDNYHTRILDRMHIDLNFRPDNLTRVVKKSQEMSFTELRQYVQRVESEGYDATIYRVDLNAKIAFPCITIILCLIGTGITISSQKNRMAGGMASKVALGIGIAFLYWIFYSFCMSLGYAEMLPPVIAAWTANLVFFCLGFYMVLRTE